MHYAADFLAYKKCENESEIGDFSLGRNWAKIEPFWAWIRIQNVPTVIQKCSYRPPHTHKILAWAGIGLKLSHFGQGLI